MPAWAIVFFDQIRKPILVQGFAALVQVEPALIWLHHQAGAYLVGVVVDPAAGAVAQGHHAVLFAFALAHHQRAVAGVHVVEFEVDQLHAADAGTVERFDDGSIADADIAMQLSLAEDALHFFVG